MSKLAMDGEMVLGQLAYGTWSVMQLPDCVGLIFCVFPKSGYVLRETLSCTVQGKASRKGVLASSWR
jgi:hypothetical protein